MKKILIVDSYYGDKTGEFFEKVYGDKAEVHIAPDFLDLQKFQELITNNRRGLPQGIDVFIISAILVINDIVPLDLLKRYAGKKSSKVVVISTMGELFFGKVRKKNPEITLFYHKDNITLGLGKESKLCEEELSLLNSYLED